MEASVSHRKTQPRRALKRNYNLSSYVGRNAPGGPERPSKAVLANRSVVADLKVRFRYLEQTAFVKEAAAALDPPESVSLFIATAALERAEKTLGRACSIPISS